MSDIWRLQSQFDNEGLIRALSHASPDIRRRAAVALRTIGAADAVPALRQALDREPDPDVRQALLLALETLDEEAPGQARPTLPEKPVTDELPTEAAELGRLLAQLESANPDEVVKAALRLGEMGDKTAAEPLVVLFTSPKTSGEIKLAVAEALLKLNSAPVEVALLASLRHTHPDVRRKGAAILGHLKAEWAVQPLGEALRDPVQIVRRTARAALKNIGTPEARKILARFDTSQPRQPSKPSAPDDSAEKPTIVKRPQGLLRRMETNEAPAVPASSALSKNDDPALADDPQLSTGDSNVITRPLHSPLSSTNDDNKPPPEA
ncbi:MAG: HEAT repeat domain-containing protein [Anaerolineae bacterium]|nr:HEAT repeat domain-containing protein [Anaerolineae bacterium]MDW8173453.1 HEAT repeat domain-containing protein [Anaerolineae bacterium]